MAVFPAVGGEVDPVLRWIALGAVPLLLVQAYLTFLIRADYGFGVTNVSWLLSPLLAAAANIALAAAGLLTVATAFLVWVGAHGVATGLLVWWIATRLEGFGRPDARLAVRTLSFGLRAHGGRAMMVGSYRVDQWFVGSIAGSHELGLYSIAVAAAEVLFYIPTVLVIVQRPYLVRASLADAARRAARVFRAGILVTAPLAAAVVAAGPLACVVLFGEDFRGAADDLRVLALGAFGVVALQQLGNALTAKGRPGLATVGATVGFAVTIALDIVLIPPYGGLGAALASTLAYTAGGLATLVLFRRLFGTRAGDLVPRPSDASALWRIGSGGLSALARGRGRLPRASTELP
jgi:O-antigen/teichoic acid export membrane protein